jgi:hypothetical protein
LPALPLPARSTQAAFWRSRLLALSNESQGIYDGVHMGGGVAVGQFLVQAICVRFIPLATLPLSDAKGSRDGRRDNRITSRLFRFR